MEEAKYRLEQDTLFVQMPNEVDHHSAKELSGRIDFLVDSWQVRHLIMDFEQTEFIDSSVIGVLIGRKRTMERQGGELGVIGLSERAYLLLSKAGVERLIPLGKQERATALK